MSRTSEVLKNRNKVEKARKARRKNEMQMLRDRSEFKAKLYDEMKRIEIILKDEDVQAVEITVPDNTLARFSAAIYAEDLADYSIEQKEGETNKFLIKRKFLAF